MGYGNEFLKEFIKRTIVNQRYIDNGVCYERNVYEVTQLVNSFLGLIIFPQQSEEIIIDDNCLSPNILDEFWELCTNQYTNNRREKNVSNLLYHLRNAISHKNLVFNTIKNQKGVREIHSISFKDVHPDKVQNF